MCVLRRRTTQAVIIDGIDEQLDDVAQGRLYCRREEEFGSWPPSRASARGIPTVPGRTGAMPQLTDNGSHLYTSLAVREH